MNLRAYNQNTQQQVRIEVRHAGPNDYRVEFTGIGEHSQHTQLGLASAKMTWLAQLPQADIEHEMDKARLIDCSTCRHKFPSTLGKHGCPNCAH
jgi:hypothetical protein